MCNKWGATICNTKSCGIECLNRGLDKTHFSSSGQDYQVDLGYIYDKNGNKCGHVEVVQDVTHLNKTIHMKKQQEELIEKIFEASNKFTELSRQVSNSAENLSTNTTEQASIVEEFIATINEISDNLDMNIQNINETNNMSMMAKEKANIGTEYMKKIVETMEEINNTSGKIKEVAEIIESIASQTNLLSLNATIESARAGSYGRGFGVVASEIRELANRSSDGVKSIREIINETYAIVSKGQKIVQDADISLKDIVKTIDDTVVISNRLTQSSEEQKASLKELTDGTKQLAEITDTNVINSQKNFAISEELVSEIENIRKLAE